MKLNAFLKNDELKSKVVGNSYIKLLDGDPFDDQKQTFDYIIKCIKKWFTEEVQIENYKDYNIKIKTKYTKKEKYLRLEFEYKHVEKYRLTILEEVRILEKLKNQITCDFWSKGYFLEFKIVE